MPNISRDLTQAKLEETASFGKTTTGINHVVFISPKGNARHAPCIKVAINPPDSLDPRGETISIEFDGKIAAGMSEPKLLQQARQFIERNRDVLLDYWDYRIDTEELRQRLRPTERK
jgi:hypothetical protein